MDVDRTETGSSWWKKAGTNWWPEEEPSSEEIAYGQRQLMQNLDRIDYVITHETPLFARAFIAAPRKLTRITTCRHCLTPGIGSWRRRPDSKHGTSVTCMWTKALHPGSARSTAIFCRWVRRRRCAGPELLCMRWKTRSTREGISPPSLTCIRSLPVSRRRQAANFKNLRPLKASTSAPGKMDEPYHAKSARPRSPLRSAPLPGSNSVESSLSPVAPEADR